MFALIALAVLVTFALAVGRVLLTSVDRAAALEDEQALDRVLGRRRRVARAAG